MKKQKITIGFFGPAPIIDNARFFLLLLKMFYKKEMKASIVFLPDKREVFIKNHVFHIGRNPANDLKLNHPYISRQHCIIYYEKDQYFIKDLHSANGVYINGKRIRRPYPLQNEDIIQLYSEAPLIQWMSKGKSILKKIRLKGLELFPFQIWDQIKKNKIIFLSFLFILFLGFISLPIGIRNKLKQSQKTAESRQLAETILSEEEQILKAFQDLMERFGELEVHNQSEFVEKISHYIQFYQENKTYELGMKNRSQYIEMIF
ncbi:MAG: FHA domain-containing protein, partial [Spirochaetes bacterium]|nr:FHA domain-containing protein [Spirochaetota bacterium]